MDVESCLGAPDEKDAEGKTTILTYYSTSTHSLSLTIQDLGGSFGGYCHATVRLEKDRVVSIHYSGDTNDPLGGPDAVCAPIVRTCYAERTSSQH